MKKTFPSGLSAFVVLALSACATGDGQRWTCTAPKLVNAQYVGGPTAMVHLSGYAYGNSYPVTKNATATEARGSTSDGTPFVCTAQSSKQP